MRKAIGILMFLAAAVSAGEVQPPVNKTNWQSHPAIVKIRRIVTVIDRAERAGRLVSAHCWKEEWDQERTIWRDSRGRALKYVKRICGEDSCWKYSQYYDNRGTLRFVLAEIGAIPDTHIEYRHYFDADGKRIWSQRRLLSGPGYPVGDDEWNAGRAALNPEQEFSRDCGK